MQRTKNTVHALFMYYSRTVHRSHNTIHTFKNYFATVFSNFNFNNNKFNPNEPIKERRKMSKKDESFKINQ